MLDEKQKLEISQDELALIEAALACTPSIFDCV